MTVRNSDSAWAARLRYSSDTAMTSKRNATTRKVRLVRPPEAPPVTAANVVHMPGDRSAGYFDSTFPTGWSLLWRAATASSHALSSG